MATQQTASAARLLVAPSVILLLLWMIVPLATPPLTPSKPPEITDPVVRPPENTGWAPPLETTVPLARPPEETNSSPAWMTVPLTVPNTVSWPLLTFVAFAVPPDRTVSESPLFSVKPLLV